MDFATFAGILAGMGFACGAVLSGIFPFSFISVPHVFLFVAGGLLALPICFSPDEIRRAFVSAGRALFTKAPRTDEAVAAMVKIAEISRREGLQALDKLHTVNPWLCTAAALIAAGADERLIAARENEELYDLKNRHNTGIVLFKKLSSLCAALGVAATLPCLAQIALFHLDYPAIAGPAAAMAVLGAFYGALLAGVFFNPIANTMKKRGIQEEVSLQVVFAGVRFILENNNPRLVYEKLSSFLPPRRRFSDEHGW